MREHPIFSTIYDFMMTPQEYLGMGEIRAKVVGGLRGRILEVGVGTGLNLRHYSPQATVVGIEPDPTMLRRAVARRDSATPSAALLAADGELLPFKSASFDAVVATLVFCTIPDAGGALRELRRVLRPGGAFHFLEHVRAQLPWLSSLQDSIDPFWAHLFGGCHPNRETLELFREAGFAIERISASRSGIIVRGEAVVA